MEVNLAASLRSSFLRVDRDNASSFCQGQIQLLQMVTLQPTAVIFAGKGGSCPDRTYDFKASRRTRLFDPGDCVIVPRGSTEITRRHRGQAGEVALPDLQPAHRYWPRQPLRGL